MGTIVMVHGAGVRAAGIKQLRQQVTAGIAGVDALAGYILEMCEYGPNVGAAPAGVAETLPKEITARAIGAEPSEDELEAARWSLLFDDPLFELRLAGVRLPAASTGVVIGGPLPSEQSRQAILRLATMPELPPAESGITREAFADAVGAVANSPELRDAASAVGSPNDADLVAISARAIAATIIAPYRLSEPGTQPPMVANGTVRDAFVDAVADRIVALSERSLVSDWLKKSIAGFVAKRATAIGVEHRLAAQQGASPVVADVVHYLRRPVDMADFVRRSLASATPPVVAVGHSLGGIILVDVLSMPDHPRVDLLVTVGSQSPILFAYDALGRPRNGDASRQPYAADRPPFTPWLNIYNRNDFVSFKAGDIFRNELSAPTLDIVDAELHLPHSFPDAHGDYWTDKRTFEFIGDRLARLPVAAGGDR